VKDDRVYLQHIRDALDDITAYCGSDRKVSSATACATTRRFESSK
jgi:hypothetical protein